MGRCFVPITARAAAIARCRTWARSRCLRGVGNAQASTRMRSATRKKLGKNPAYLEWLHTLPCWICRVVYDMLPGTGFALGPRKGQNESVEAAHVGERGLSQ